MKPQPSAPEYPAARDDLPCADCGAVMELRTTTKFRYGDGTPRPFYGCTNFPQCKGTHGAHPDGAPLGTPADSATKQARIKAHEAFDILWKGAGAPYTRDQAYVEMQSMLRLKSDEAHIGLLNEAQCEALVLAIDKRMDFLRRHGRL